MFRPISEGRAHPGGVLPKPRTVAVSVLRPAAAATTFRSAPKLFIPPGSDALRLGFATAAVRLTVHSSTQCARRAQIGIVLVLNSVY